MSRIITAKVIQIDGVFSKWQASSKPYGETEKYGFGYTRKGAIKDLQKQYRIPIVETVEVEVDGV